MGYLGKMYAAARYANAQKGPGWASLVLLTSFWCRFGVGGNGVRLSQKLSVGQTWCINEPHHHHNYSCCTAFYTTIAALHCDIKLISIHCKVLDSSAAQLLTIYICIGLNCIASEACRNSGNASLSEFATRLAEIKGKLRNVDIKSLVGQ